MTLTRGRHAHRLDRGADFNRVAAWALAHLAALVEEYAGVTLRRGRCACPLHGGENGQAFSVTDGKGWHCHTGCGGIGGDGVDFVRRLRYATLEPKAGRLAALRELAPRAGVVLEGFDDHPRHGRARHRAAGQAPRTMARPPIGPQRGNTGRARGAIGPREMARPGALGGVGADRTQKGEAALREVACMGCVVQDRTALNAGVLDVLSLTERGRAYLAGRGLDPEAAAQYGFRSVDDAAGWRALEQLLRESYLPAEREAAGWHALPWGGRAPALVIPYHAGGQVRAVRFRRLDDGAPKYHALAGVEIALPFHADALDDVAGAELHVVEGELNAYTLTTHGLRAIGLPGAGTWRADWTARVARAGRLVAWYDGDAAGEQGRAKLARTLAGAMGAAWLRTHGRAVTLDGGDVNDAHRAGQLAAHLAHGAWRD